MTTATPSLKHGHTIEYEIESALGTCTFGSDQMFRHEEGLTFPTNTRLVAPQANLGYSVGFNKPDVPIAYEAARESALKIPVHMRRAAGGGTDKPMLALFAESGGCNVTYWKYVDDGTYTDESNLTLTGGYLDNDAGANTGGHAGLFENANSAGDWCPALLAQYTEATKDTDLAIELASQPNNGEAVEQMFTITPRTRQVPTTATMGFRLSTRGKSSTAPDLTLDYKGCALASIDNIIIEPNIAPIINCNFHVADVAKGEATLPTETLKDGATYQPVGGNFQTAFCETSAPPKNIALTQVSLIRAEVDLGIKTVTIPGYGGTTVVNGIDGYQADYTQATVNMQMLMDIQYWTEIEKADPADRKYWYLHFVQPTSDLDVPAWGLWFPRMYIVDIVEADLQGNEYMVCTLKLGASSAEFDPTTEDDNDDTEMLPWAWAISGDAGAAP